MKMIRLDGLRRIGFGSFFVVFHLSEMEVLKVPSMYDSWPTAEAMNHFKALDLTPEEWIVLDAMRGSELSGAAPVHYVTAVESPIGSRKLGLVMPTMRVGEVSAEEIADFVGRHQHWNWDNHPSNYGHYLNSSEVFRTDTQTKVSEDLFYWV